MATTQLLDQIINEQETLIFPHFTADDAFEIGIHLRQTARTLHSKIPVSIRITLATGQIIFSTLTTGPAVADSESWLRRKTNAVFRRGIG
ncbi:putative DUF967 domain protein [Lyophyllum shimeji]|uniref:DUF967 domain protein n=1 Tax=Lyophyllum shimeji TaxID=47721 RepID=A0A9P3UV51_LYOSH|nr:putative DUF967 domain protein [Lyophyllum shimeji]